MAERRMFAKSVIGSGKFLRMPPTSRLLYYDLGMAADDDGVVEAFSVMRMTGATEDDLRVLVSKGFVKVLNDELVILINDWKVNNLIKNDRYKPSIYKDLLVQFNGLPNGTQMEPEWNQVGTQMEPQVRLGKDSIDKNSIDKNKREYINNNINISCETSVYEIPLIGGEKFGITESFINEMQKLYTAVDVDGEIRKMIGWCMGNPDRLKTSKGIKRFITSWLSKAQDSGGNRNANHSRNTEFNGRTFGTEL